MFTISILRTTAFGLVLFLCSVPILGCTMFGGGKKQDPPREIGQKKGPSYTEKDLQNDILKFASRFEAYIRSTADKIYAGSNSPKIHKRTLLWKLRIVPVVHQIATGTDPRVNYLALAYLTRTMKLYLTVGDGKDVFGNQQSLAVKTTSELNQMVLDIGEEFLDAKQMDKFRKNVQIYAEKHPIRGPEFSLEMARKSIQKIDQSNEFSWITDISLKPVGAMSGISAMPAAIRDLSTTLWGTTYTIKHLPRLVRWQIELLLYDVESRDSIQNIMKTINTVDETSRKTGQHLEVSAKSILDYAFLGIALLMILATLLFLGYRVCLPSKQTNQEG